MDEVQEIKTKLDIVAVISEYISVNKAGVNWKGNCPFHNEKTPSFMVNQDRQFYYCFGCSEGGDLFTFVQKIEGLDFAEALKLLAKKAGVTLTQAKKRATNQKTRLIDANELACRYWQKVVSSEYGKDASSYLVKRGLSEKTIADFRLGYALDSWDHLFNFLRKRGFNETEIIQSGLAVPGQKGKRPYDRFRDRVIFPILDIHGTVVGFTGRAMKDGEYAKYINTPETAIYHKGHILYGLDKAKKYIRDQDYVVVVEGNMDVIASHKVGVQNVVAVSGTALTQEQIGLIKRFTSNVSFCFDMDEAGQKAAKRSIDLALQNEMNIKIVQLVSGKDPDDCIKNNVQDWAESIKSAKSVMQYYFDRAFTKFNVGKIEDKKEIAKALLLEINKIVNLIEKDYWIKSLAEKLDVSSEILRASLPSKSEFKVRATVVPTQVKKVAVEPQKPQVVKTKAIVLQEILISLLLDMPKQIEYAGNHLSPEMMTDKLQQVYKNFIIWYSKDNNLSKEKLSELLCAQEILDISEDYLRSLTLYVDKDFAGWEDKDKTAELVKVISQIKRTYYDEQIGIIQQKLATMDQRTLKTEESKLFKDLQELIYKKNQLD